MSNKAYIADCALPRAILQKKVRLIEDTLEHHLKLDSKHRDQAWLKWATARLKSLRDELQNRPKEAA